MIIKHSQHTEDNPTSCTNSCLINITVNIIPEHFTFSPCLFSPLRIYPCLHQCKYSHFSLTWVHTGYRLIIFIYISTEVIDGSNKEDPHKNKNSKTKNIQFASILYISKSVVTLLMLVLHLICFYLVYQYVSGYPTNVSNPFCCGQDIWLENINVWGGDFILLTSLGWIHSFITLPY